MALAIAVSSAASDVMIAAIPMSMLSISPPFNTNYT